MFPRCEGVRWDTVRMLPSMQTGHSLTQGSAIGVGKDLVPTICQAAQQRVADQTFPMRLVIRQALGGAVDEDAQRLRQVIACRDRIQLDHPASLCLACQLVSGNSQVRPQKRVYHQTYP